MSTLDSNTPTLTPSNDSATSRDKIVTFIQATAAVLGLAGVSLPSAFTNLAFEQQVAGVILLAVPLILGWYDRIVTKPAQIHAAAVASARRGLALKPAA